jgi:phosphatidylglycerophosphate synthase
MQQTQILTISLPEIMHYIPNMITGFRLVLLYCAVFFFQEAPLIACGLLMTSVVLDYADGYAARRYKQCSFFGDTFDWIVDTASSAVVYFWWATLQPNLIFLIFTLMTMEIVSMIMDIIAKSHGFTPIVRDNHWLTSVLKYTMNLNRKGASYITLGYWNEIFHYVCIVARVMFLRTSYAPWSYLFFLTLPASVSYVWMNVAYAKNISDSWNETMQNNEARVVFVERE